MKIILFIFSAILLLSCVKNGSNPDDKNGIPDLKGWELVWNDEFSKEGMPDSTLWKYEWGPNWYNDELQYYTNGRPENVRVKNGYLILEARHETFYEREYTSTRLNSRANWTYGRMELRARLPKGNALWPALWMMPVKNTYGGWPKSGEIDIMENWSWEPTGIYGTVHTEAYNHVIGTQKGGKINVAAPWEHFYTYAVEWTADKIDWFVDDSLYYSFPNEGGTDKWPFNQPFFFILNIAVEKTAPGQENTWAKTTMEVDYVRVYRRKGQ